jgi:hypothetical protein
MLIEEIRPHEAISDDCILHSFYVLWQIDRDLIGSWHARTEIIGERHSDEREGFFRGAIECERIGPQRHEETVSSEADDTDRCYGETQPMQEIVVFLLFHAFIVP